MRKYLIDRNIGYDFKKKKSKIPGLKESKLKQLFQACINTNNCGDISLINSNNLPDFDLFNFSFPCTNISVAGKQEGMQDKQGNITSSGLYIYGINIIKIKKPKYIMIENVKNLIGKKFINDFYNIINELNEIGYNCYYPKNSKDKPICLNAKDYGVPQNRERIYVICIRKDIDTYDFQFPIGKDYGIRLKDILEDKVDEKYYISQDKTNKLLKQLTINTQDRNGILINKGKIKIKKDDISSCLDANYWKGLDNHAARTGILENNINIIGKLNIKGQDNIRRVYNTDGISPALTTMEGGNRQPKILESNELQFIGGIGNKDWVGDGKNNSRNYPQGNRVYNANGIACSQTAQGGGVGSYSGLYLENTNRMIVEGNTVPSGHTAGRVFNIDGISPTVMDRHSKGVQIFDTNKYRIRKLTPKECWRLMGFNDEDIDKCIDIGISNTQLYKQAGNSIVVKVLEYIFKNLFKTK